MSSTAAYLRLPSIHSEQVVFVTEDDLWSVDTSGGVARRLTSDLVEIGRPAISPDGELVAFASKSQGQPDVHVMPALGGPSQRLTWLGQASVLGWTPDGRVVVASATGQPFSSLAFAYAISPTPTPGAGWERLGYGPISAVSFAPQGAGVVTGRNTADPARWKRYRGGTAGALWIDPEGSGTWRPLLSAETLAGSGAAGSGGAAAFPGNLACPMWIGGRIWFLSDHEGIANLYSIAPDGAGLRRHTDHGEHYARWASSDGRRIVYQVAAQLWLHDPTDDTSRQIEVEVRSPKTQRQVRFVHADRFFGDAELDHKGERLVMDVRGKLVTMVNWERAVRQHGRAQGVRYRLGRWLGDTGSVVVVSDEGGEEGLEVYSPGPSAPTSRAGGPGAGGAETLYKERVQGAFIVQSSAGDASFEAQRSGRRRLDIPELGRVVELVPSPDGRRAAVTNHRNQLLVVDLSVTAPGGPVPDGAAARVIDHSRFGRPTEPAWSPDGRWLAYSFPASQHTRLIRLASVDGSAGDGEDAGRSDDEPSDSGPSDSDEPSAAPALYDVTAAEFQDWSPAFDPEGRWLCFLSHRSFDPVYDSVVFDLGFPRAAKPYLVTLHAEDPSPFLVRPEELADAHSSAAGAAGRESGHGGDREADEISPTKPVRIDLEGIAGRAVAFPVPEGRYESLHLLASKALWLSHPIEGALGRDILATGAHATGSIECYDQAEAKHEALVEGVSAFGLSGDGTKLAYLAHGDDGSVQLRVIPAGAKPPEDHDDSPGRASGWVDLGRIRLAVDPGAEWAQMLREAWRLQREHFWVADMSGVDWDQVLERYLPLVELVATRSEFSDLMWEMQGELGTSHAYELGGDYRPPPDWGLGHLGAHFAWDPETGRWRVSKVATGTSWDPREASPLDAPGVGVGVGAALVAVNDQPVTAEWGPNQLLANQSGQTVELLVEDPPSRATLPAVGAPAGGPAESGGRRVLVVALADDRPLWYREWVSANRAQVLEATGGRAGYVHIPDMGPVGFAEFHRNFGPEADRGALIVDARFNRGGHVSALLLEKLARRRLGWDVSRWGPMEPYPPESVGGPMVCLTNEHAGSDGDIFSHGFKMLGLGPVVGTRTWGGVIGISPSHALVDGSLTTQPEYAFWFSDVGWEVENHGADPDVEVVIRPEDHAANRDPQLDQAIQLVVAALGSHAPPLPDLERRQSRSLPKLPARRP